MGSLASMIEFLKDTFNDLDDIRNKLDEVQEYFNNNFSNVRLVRNSEIEYLQEEFHSDREKFPEEISEMYSREYKNQEKIFNKNIKELRLRRDELNSQLDSANNQRLRLLKKIRISNKRLDNREEKLKKSVSELEAAINKYNSKIDELNTGFGFVSNLFGMKRIQREKDELIDKRDDLVEDIEEIRQKWQERSEVFSDEEGKIQEEWNNIQVEFSLISEKLANLTENGPELIEKATFINALENLKGDEEYLLKEIDVEIPDKCTRCKSKNSSNKFFCNYCGERFSGGRKDLIGSLVEVGELNKIYNSLQEGLKQSVSFLALIKGIQKGIEEFKKSVESVKESQDQYAQLPNLDIDVPGFSIDLAKSIDELNKKIDVKFKNLHPVEFSDSMKEYIDKLFTESNIENFFEKMGDELNITTKEQW